MVDKEQGNAGTRFASTICREGEKVIAPLRMEKRKPSVGSSKSTVSAQKSRELETVGVRLVDG